MRSSSCIYAVCALWATSSLVASAQTFKTLVNFNVTDGAAPQYEALAQSRDGNLWGTAGGGGSQLFGTAFRMTPGGVLTTVFNFDSAHGIIPVAGLVLGTDNYLYGVTNQGGTDNGGVVFRLAPTGALTVLFNLDFQTGSLPEGTLTQGMDSNFYGTGQFGGQDACGIVSCGNVFKFPPGGTLTTLYEFDGTHGANPTAGLVQATDGNFYGTTSAGGTSTNCNGLIGCGTVFRLTPAGTLTVLHRFHSSDGAEPHASLVQGTDGKLYGTTEFGGVGNAGTVFQITRGGTLTTLYNFAGGADGGKPFASLVEGTDGNFYGTTSAGGSSSNCTGGCGTVFQITPSGALTTVHSFNGTDGAEPLGGLVQHTSGVFFGTTEFGGTDSDGTLFSLDMGLGPFIKTVTTFGKVGSRVQILGTGLAGATAVTFNGTPASFTVEENTFMVATVPAGATTGPVQVTTAAGTTVVSNVSFRVAP